MRTVFIVVVLLTVGSAAFAQTPSVTAADVARLETQASDVDRQVATLSRTDPTLAADLQRQLREIRDDITYLKVKLRREGAVASADFADVRDRLDVLRVKATGRRVSAQPVLGDVDRVFVIPVGTELDVRLQTGLNSGVARLEQRFEATTIVDLRVGENVAIPAGTVVRGFVSSVRAAGRVERKGSLTLSFDEILLRGTPSKLRASIVQAIDGKVSDDMQRVGAGAVVGAIIGGILGGGKGALVGVLVGGGGTIASTQGANVDLPVGTILRIRIDEPLEIQRMSNEAMRH